MESKFGKATPVKQSQYGKSRPLEDDVPEWEREARDPSLGMSAGEAFIVGTGRGMEKFGQGIRALWNLATGDRKEYDQIMAQQKEASELLGPLKKRFPKSTMAGEITGEIVAGAPLGIGAGSVGGAAARKAGMGALGQGLATGGAAGAAEGAAIGAAEGQGSEGALLGGTVGAASEVLLPKLFGYARRLFRGLTERDFNANIIFDSNGNPQPTPQFEQALNERGVSWDELVDQGIQDIRAGSPEEAANLALFKQQGVEPAAQSRISGDIGLSEAQQVENWYLRKTNDPTADELRSRMLQEQSQIEQRFNQVANELGIPEEAGESLKSGLKSNKSVLASERRSAYEELGRLAEDQGLNIPISKQGILSAAAKVDELPIPETVERAIFKQLAKFGFTEGTDLAVPQSPLSMLVGRPESKQLTVANLEELRQGINRAFQGHDDAASKLARKQLIDSIDRELDVIADIDPGATGKVAELRDQAQRARSLRTTEGAEFEAKDIVQDLLAHKSGTSTPMIDAAEVLPKLRGLKKEGEFNKLVSNLERGTPESRASLGNLQAAVVMDILNRSKQPSRALGAERVPLISGTSMSKAMDQFGRKKLERLFKSNPEALKNLLQLEQINKRRVTTMGNVQTGSLPPHLINNLWNSISSASERMNLPLGAQKTVRTLMPGDPESKARKAAITIKPTPQDLEDFTLFNSQFLTELFGTTAKQAPSVGAVSEVTEREYE